MTLSDEGGLEGGLGTGGELKADGGCEGETACMDKGEDVRFGGSPFGTGEVCRVLLFRVGGLDESGESAVGECLRVMDWRFNDTRFVGDSLLVTREAGIGEPVGFTGLSARAEAEPVAGDVDVFRMEFVRVRRRLVLDVLWCPIAGRVRATRCTASLEQHSDILLETHCRSRRFSLWPKGTLYLAGANKDPIVCFAGKVGDSFDRTVVLAIVLV